MRCLLCWDFSELTDSPEGHFFHIPSDLVVDRKASAVRGSLILDFPCIPYSRPRNLPENNISNIDMLKIYH
jgi:hypothetical protein